MEIVLDARLLRAVLEAERGGAGDDLRQAGPLRALARSQLRHDARLASAPDAHTLACRAGCAWCCHFTIDVRAVEVFAILDHLDAGFTPERRAQVLAAARANAAALQGLDDVGRMALNVRCPFLADGTCSIYPVRPQTCRNYHATDAAGCRSSWENPHDLDIDPEFAPGVYQVGGAHVEAFGEVLREAGFDADAYELNAALVCAAEDPDARERFLARLSPFPGLEGTPVPAEFAESLDEA
jgi:Fe-S-cluster containining protein